MGLVLIDGQGNFGSVDNDPPAQMRYTECRMTRAAEALHVSQSALSIQLRKLEDRVQELAGEIRSAFKEKVNPKKKEEPKVEEKKPVVKSSVMILIKDVYVRNLPDGTKKMWFFGKGTEVVISSPVDGSSEWVEVKDKNGRKGYTNRENLKEKN
jgi:hypothetical protein